MYVLFGVFAFEVFTTVGYEGVIVPVSILLQKLIHARWIQEDGFKT